ncbi:galactose-3-o-sulfotransferase 3 [Plakobranchus ocellatus]|uniref:Galactose-3-o-sulfotransferase 3 n=1 Tax=Plakobranchus ocellatus TaxID=259542 RepID=A0AAV4CHD8_9GAST|nr:galactose-3-o-sulfotransferase 3 [Plakobranchus ocellatus]
MLFSDIRRTWMVFFAAGSMILLCGLLFVDMGKIGFPTALKLASVPTSNYLSARLSKIENSELPNFYQNCLKQPEAHQIVFAKIHKAASSTVQNILLHFALARNLSVLLPALSKGPILSQTESKIQPEKIIEYPVDKSFDILCSHVLYDTNEVRKYFTNKAVRVAIIREPMNQTLSALRYYATSFPSDGTKAGLKKHPNNPINGFLSHPDHFCSSDKDPRVSFINN